MRIVIVSPSPTGPTGGNQVTAARWQDILRGLGHGVELVAEYAGQACDLLVALHARRSAPSIERFHAAHPDRPLFVALTGTDLYADLHAGPESLRSMVRATRLIALQSFAAEELPESLRDRVRVIHQSVEVPHFDPPPPGSTFDVCVMGHLRGVKDPFRTARAARLVPAESSLRVLHLGNALSEDLAEEAWREERENPRYRWLGGRPRDEALRLLAGTALLSLTSHLEGGANVISESIVLGVPVVCSAVAGNLGLLGADYPGTFPVGDTAALAGLLWRVESDSRFRAELRRRCHDLRPLFDPAVERQRWADLLAEAAV